MTPQQYDALPSEIKAILDSFDENADWYQECERISAELTLKGYVADYGLSGVIDIWKAMDQKEVKAKDNFHKDSTHTYYEIESKL